MEIAYSPLTSSPLSNVISYEGSEKKIKLRYYPIYSAVPSYFNYQKPQDFLTDESLRNQLLSKKIEILNNLPICFNYTESLNVSFGLIIAFLSSVALMIFGSGFNKEPINQLLPLCSRTFKHLRELDHNETDGLTLTYPCEFDGWVPKSIISTFLPMPLIVVTMFVAGIANCCFKVREDNLEKDSDTRYNDQLELVRNRLDDVDDLSETSAWNAAIAFPYLNTDQLRLLNFSQLKKAKKHFEELFSKKLEDSCFSNQQLSIWRLLHRIMNADSERKIEMMHEAIYQEIIGSDPHFFQTLIKKMSPLNDRIKEIFSNILRDLILTENMASELTDEDTSQIVQAVSDGSKLKEAIALQLYDVEEACDNKQFQNFLNSGKLEANDYLEVYQFLKQAKEKQLENVENWAEKHLEKNLEKILNSQNLKSFLDEIIELNLESLKLKIDQHFERNWINRKDQTFDPEQFEVDYVFAKEYQLGIFEYSLKQYYRKEIGELVLPLDENILLDQINLLSSQIERLFEEQKNLFLKHLVEKVNTWLETYPQNIEKIANAASKDQNQWLIDLIKQAYHKNSAHYSSYWLSPFENFEVIVNK